MTQTASVYAQALYGLVKETCAEEDVLQQMRVLCASFQEEPNFLRLLSDFSIGKQERIRILDDSFREKLHPYLLNFMKLLTEKGHIRQFPDCFKEYQALYNEDNGILPVRVMTAVPLTDEQKQRLTEKLCAVTDKNVRLDCRVDPELIGGVRLDYGGKRIDGTLQSRLDAVRNMLKSTLL